jgi:hypothetical protein
MGAKTENGKQHYSSDRKASEKIMRVIGARHNLIEGMSSI